MIRDIAQYSDQDVRQELVDFFGWPTKNVLELNTDEIRAWKKHFLSLREAGFFYIKGEISDGMAS